MTEASGQAGDPNCPECHGRGWFVVDDLTERWCRCLQRRMIREHLGDEISLAKSVRSPLFVAGADGIDRTEENLFIKGHWSTILSHLRWALGCKFNLKPKHRFRIATDERLLDVWFSRDAYGQRPKEVRESVETFNSLRDFVEEQDLFILRLGFLGHPNKALPGVIKQALGIREVLTKPTWIIEGSPPYYFGPGHRAYSEELEEYININFDIVDLRDFGGGESPPARESGREVVAASEYVPSAPTDDDGEASMGAAPNVFEPEPIATEERMKPRKDKRRGTWKPGKKKGGNGGNNPMEDLG